MNIFKKTYEEKFEPDKNSLNLIVIISLKVIL